MCPFLFGILPQGSACSRNLQWRCFWRLDSHTFFVQAQVHMYLNASAHSEGRGGHPIYFGMLLAEQNMYMCAAWSFPHLMRRSFSKSFLCLKLFLTSYCFCHICRTECWELNTALQVRVYAWFIKLHCGLLCVNLEAIHYGSLCPGRLLTCCCWAKVFIHLSPVMTPRWSLHALENYTLDLFSEYLHLIIGIATQHYS